MAKDRMDTGVNPSHKKILFVSHEGSKTGAPLFLVKLLRYLKVERPEYKIAIFFTKNGEVVDQLVQDGFDVFVSEKRGNLNSKLAKFWNRFIHYLRYLKIFFSYRPNLVYSNTIVNFGEIILAGLFRIPVLMHMHEGKEFSIACRYRLKISSLFANRIIVGSHYVNSVLNWLTGRFGVVVYNGVDFPAEISVKRRQSNLPLKIGVLGTINSNKGQLVVIKAIHLLIRRGLSAKLKIAGKISDLEYYAQLCNFVKQNSLEDFVEFVGVVPYTDVFLNSLDLLVVPSFDEAFPTVILEAFSTGTLIVASNVGGIPEMIENKVNGFLFKAGDYMMLTETIQKIFDDKELTEWMPLSALNILHEKFDVSKTNRFLAINLDDMLLRASTVVETRLRSIKYIKNE